VARTGIGAEPGPESGRTPAAPQVLEPLAWILAADALAKAAVLALAAVQAQSRIPVLAVAGVYALLGLLAVACLRPALSVPGRARVLAFLLPLEFLVGCVLLDVRPLLFPASLYLLRQGLVLALLHRWRPSLRLGLALAVLPVLPPLVLEFQAPAWRASPPPLLEWALPAVLLASSLALLVHTWRRFPGYRLEARLALLLLAVSLLPLTVLGHFGYLGRRADLERSLEDRLQGAAAGYASLFAHVLEEMQRDVTTWAGLPPFAGLLADGGPQNEAAARRALWTIQHEYPETVLRAGMLQRDGSIHPLSRLGLDPADPEVEDFLAGFSLQQPPGLLLWRPPGAPAPELVFHAPIRDAGGRVPGRLLVTAPAALLESRSLRMKQLLDRRSLAALYAPGLEEPLVLTARRLPGPATGEQEALRAGGAAWIRAVAELPLPGWRVAAVQSREVARLQALEETRSALLLAFGVLVAGAALALVLARRFTAPLKTLAQAAERVRAGNLSVQVPVFSDDEVGELSRAFNQMTAELRLAWEDLQQEIRRSREAHDRLERSEQRYRQLVEEAPLGVVATDRRGRITAVNPAALDLLGAPSADFLLGLAAPFSGNPTLREHAGRAIQRIRQEGQASGEFHFTSRWGREVDLRYQAVPIRGARGRVEGYLLVLEDRSRRRALEEQLGQAQKMEALGALAGGIAHDFNNLLTAILGGIQLARLEEATGEELQRRLQEVEEAALRATSLTSQLLRLARPEAPEFRRLSVEKVVEDTAALLRRTLPENLDLRLRLAGGLPPVEGDAGQLQNALLNLAINARDALEGSAGTLLIETSLVCLGSEDVQRNPQARPGAFVRIRVQDDGPGIPAIHRERIFDPFFTTKEPGQGTGLGLAMVASCLDAHGGWIQLAPEPGPGACFDLFLPILREEIGAGEVREPAAGASLEEGQGRILVVDDMPAITGLAREILERAGYEVLTARNGRHAWSRLEEMGEEIDLVLTDLVMPEAGGRELLQEMRRAGMDQPVILFSGYALGASEEELLEEGFAAVVAKPFDALGLCRVVGRVLRSRRLRTPARREDHD